MSRFSKSQYYRNLKKQNWQRLNEDVYGMSEEHSGFADTGVHMENIDNMDSNVSFHNTTIQFEPEEQEYASENKDADVQYIQNVINVIKSDLDKIASKVSEVQMTEDSATGVVSYNYLFDNHTIVNSIIDVANTVSSTLEQVNSAVSAQTTDEQQQEVVDTVVDNWTDNQIDATDDSVVDVVVVNDEVGQYGDTAMGQYGDGAMGQYGSYEDDTEAPYYEDEENIINDILTRTHSMYRNR